MQDFMSDNYMLTSVTAASLYEKAKGLPIVDYHCHLSEKEIYDDRKFFNLCELWLECDHYKWRVMRNAGISEDLITGSGSPYEKFLAFATVLPDFIGNPVYHWAHLELKKYFGITVPICAENAKSIWDKTVKIMSGGTFSARNLIKKSNVKCVVTTNDPVDQLNYHKLLRAENLSFSVLPCFRPDKIINIEKSGFTDYIRELENAVGFTVDGIDSLEKALSARLDYFIENGCPAADCSFENFPKGKGDRHAACLALKARINGEKVDDIALAEYKTCIIKFLAKAFNKAEIVMQIHTGVVRNQNTKRFNLLGTDCGIDNAGNALNVVNAGNLFDMIENDGGLPKTIIYTLNPNSYYPLATMLGDFAGETRGKLQLGAAWWFMDHRDGIREQLKIFAATGGLGLFNGMLTDSRSFTSYARHDYFRRILCSVIAEWIDAGEYPNGLSADKLIADICYFNAEAYFNVGEKK